MELHDMIFLEDPKVVKEPGAAKAGIPGPIHLVRRGDYLCGLIREYEENRRMLIEQQAVIANMPVKEGYGYDHPPLPVPVPTSSTSFRSSSSSKQSAAAAAAAATAAADKGKRRKTPEYTDSEDEESYASMDEDAVKELLRPAKKHLVSCPFKAFADWSQKKLKSGTESLSREEKIAALKECVAGIGSRIDEVVQEKAAAGEDSAKWRKHCWVFASFFWPRQGVNYAKLMDIHSKLVSTPCFWLA